MSRRSAALLVDDMLAAIDRIATYAQGLEKTDFLSDRRTGDAVVRNLEILGEAANRLPADLREQWQEVPWRLIIGLRNRVIHEYFGVDWEIIWTIVTRDMPEFRKQLTAIRENLMP